MKRGTSAEWALASAHILADGEIAVETDTHKMKIGDGETIYKNLPYVGSSADANVYWQAFESKN